MSFKMKTAGLVGAALFFIIYGCGPIYVQTEPQEQLLKRAKKYQAAINSNTPEIIWELSSPSIKRDNLKDEYTKSISSFIELAKMSAEEPSIITFGGKWALTQSIIQATFVENGREFFIKSCQMTAWLKYSDNWYWEDSGMTCDRFLDKAEDLETKAKLLP